VVVAIDITMSFHSNIGAALMWMLYYFRGPLIFFLAIFSYNPLMGQATSEKSLMLNEEWLTQAWQGGIRVSQEDLSPVNTVELVDVGDRSSVIAYVLRNCPMNPVVFPTEHYYYFKFFWKHRFISGNLRFCDASKGIVHFGYFDEFDPSFLKSGTIEESVNGQVRLIEDKVLVRFMGTCKEFTIASLSKAFEPPVLSDEEKLIANIVDESGYCFCLIYNKSQRLLYYTLNDSRKPEDRVELVFGDVALQIGLHSRFVFFKDNELNRFILVGVLSDNVRRNNYFDGPFDQVPPSLEIKDILENVYPYLRQRQIDQHGNFLDEAGSRVAISPYRTYAVLSEIVDRTLAASLEDIGDGKLSVSFYELVRESKGVAPERELAGSSEDAKDK
jgi:hypothetical protein